MLHFIFGTGSVVFNCNLQEQNASMESFETIEKCLLMQKTLLVKIEHRKITSVELEPRDSASLETVL